MREGRKYTGFVPVGWIKKGLVHQLNPTCGDCSRLLGGYCPEKDCYVGPDCPACELLTRKFTRRTRR